MKIKYLPPIIVSLFFFFLDAKAQNDTTKTQLTQDSSQVAPSEDVFSMSIEDLMDVKVTTASKNAERIQDAPAAMSVMTAKEIEGFGALTLSELLNRLTSTYMVSTSFAPEGMLSIRGKQTEHYNTNVLILMDGRPVRESFHGGYNGIIYNMFPVTQIERIEIIRGPGSVLYGSNAYVGVINLITKKGSDNAIQSTIRYGTFNTVQALASVNKKVKDLEIGFGLNAMHSDGWDFTARGEKDVVRNKKNTADSVFKDPNTIKRDDKGVGATLKLGYKGFTFNAFAATNDWSTMGRITDWSKPNDYRIRNNRVFADLGYLAEVNKYWSVSFNGTYNYFDFKSYSTGIQNDLTRRGSSDGLVEVTNYIKPLKNFNIVLGGLTNMQSGEGVQFDYSANGTQYDVTKGSNNDPWVTVPKYDMVWNSAYIQMDYTPWKFMKLIAGGQANKIPGFYTDFVPRLGTILYLNENIGTKLLYGQAFRAATAFERLAYSPPSVYGDPQLTPEKITTYEAQVFYTKSKIDVSATYFYNYDGNKISRANVINPTMYTQKYVNAGYVTTQGLEVEAKLKLGTMFSFYGSSSYQTSNDYLGRKDYDGMPNLMTKLGLLFNYHNKYTAGLYNSYIGTGGDINTYSTSGATLTMMANPPVAAYNDMSLNVSANLKNIINANKMPDLSVQCYVTNLLDEKIYYAEVVRRKINSLPGRPGRAINIGATIKF